MNKSEQLKFAQHFVENHQYAAARAVEELPAEVAGSFIDAIDDTSSELALMSMLPYHAAKCIDRLSPEAASRYISQMNPQAASRILRQLSQQNRRTLIDALPRRKALHISLILSYPQALVGAWMDPVVYPVPFDETISNARKKVSSQKYSHNVLYAVDNNNHIVGSVSLIKLLQHEDASSTLGTIMSTEVEPVFASITLGRAIKSHVWINQDSVPVVDREHQLIGILRYRDLRQATATPVSTRHIVEDSQSVLGITESFCLGLSDLLKTTLEYRHPHSTPQQPTDEEIQNER